MGMVRRSMGGPLGWQWYVERIIRLHTQGHEFVRAQGPAELADPFCNVITKATSQFFMFFVALLKKVCHTGRLPLTCGANESSGSER